MSIKDGKKPLSQKPSRPSSPDSFGNLLAIPAEIQAELDAQGLVGHWLNSKTLYANQGYHPRGWQVYRRKASDTIASTFKFGNDPDGIVRRGDCILGFKTKENHREHKDYLESRAQRSTQTNAEKAQEMRALLRQSGIKGSKVLEGYEENE